MKFFPRLSLLLRILALVVLLIGTGLWLRDGARIGWTRTSVEVMHRDEITEIDYPVRQDTFVAGVEVPVAGIVAAVFLFGIGWVLRKK